MIEIKKIPSKEIGDVMTFIANGFKMNPSLIARYWDFTAKSCKELGYCAFGAYQNGVLVGIRLVALQGYCDDIPILNLHALYFLPSFRGRYVSKFMQAITRAISLDGAIATTYSPNSANQKLSLKNKFEYMGAKRVLWVPLHIFSLLSLRNIRKKYVALSDVVLPLNFSHYYRGDSQAYDLFVGASTIRLTFHRATCLVIKSISFPIPYLHISWASNEKNLLKNLNLICYNLCLKYKVFFVKMDLFCSELKTLKKVAWVSGLPYMICRNGHSVDWLPLLGSEYCWARD